MPATDAKPAKTERTLTEIMAECDRHLMIVHHLGQQSISDWRQVAAHVRRIDPRIGVFVVSAREGTNPEVLAAAALKPTLVFSPSPVGKVAPLRGKVYQGHLVPKFKQLQMLAAAGVPVPATQVLQPGTVLDPKKLGPFVVVKPLDMITSSRGLGMTLMRTERVKYVAPADYPAGHPGRRGPMIAQQFIDSGPKFSSYRVLALFGTPLYSIQIQSNVERARLTDSDETLEASPIATQQDKGRQRSFIYKADLMQLARAVHAAIPQVPLKGIDVMRDAQTGRLYVLETNPGGNTWHFSSRHNAQVRATEGPDYVRQLYGQLDAMATAAYTLVDVTRREAE